MKLKIKNNLLGLKIYDQNGKSICEIKKDSTCADTQLIVDKNYNLIYKAKREACKSDSKSWNNADNVKYMLYNNKEAVAKADISFAKDPKPTGLSGIIKRRHQVDEMNITCGSDIYKVNRLKNDSVIIKRNGDTIIKISGFFGVKAITLETNDDYDIMFITGIYSLVNFMMNEEELIENK